MPFIPNSSLSRRYRGFSLLVRRILPRHPMPFDGKFIRAGSSIDIADLRPDHDWPETPTLIEFAGPEASASEQRRSGHNRGKDLHILWQWNAAASEWFKTAAIAGHGSEWILDMKPIVERLVSNVTPVNCDRIAREAADRVLESMDRELETFDGEMRSRALGMLFEDFAARMMSEAA